MRTSQIIAAVISLGVVGGGALAVARGSESSLVSARQAVCASRQLSPMEQDSCKSQMEMATSEIGKQQIATRFQSKIDIRNAVATGPSTPS